MRVRANLNECPTPPPERVTRAAERALEAVNRYPDPSRRRLLEELYADYAGVDAELVVAVPGSDTVLEILWWALRPLRLAVLHPGFYSLTGIAGWIDNRHMLLETRRPWREPLLDSSVLEGLSGTGVLAAVEDPGNPLGLRSLPDRLPGGVEGFYLLVDEAYYEYVGYTHVSEAVDSDTLAVARTLSKAFSLASARVGFLIAGPTLAERLRRDPLPFRIPSPSLEAAIAALEDPSYARRCAVEARREAERIAARLEKIGLRVTLGRAHYMLVYTGDPEAAALLRERGVIVAGFPQLGPGTVRVTPQSRRENDYIIEVFERLADERGWSGG